MRSKLMKWTLSTHRVLGAILSLFLLMWFGTGMVMLYHDYPRVGDKEVPHQPALTIADLEQLPTIIEAKPNITAIELTSHMGKSVLNITSGGEQIELDAQSGNAILQPVTLEEVCKHVQQAWQVPIKKEKVMKRLDVWTPFPTNLQHLPLYCLTLDDKVGTELYYSSQTGELLQYTTRIERFWSWIGPIPHYFYITPLRQNRNLWMQTVVWIAGLGSVMCLAGLIVGLVMYYKVWRHKHRIRTPYRRPYYLKWHHIFGMIAGLFTFLFIFSGALSFSNMPEILKKKQQDPALSTLIQSNGLLQTATLQSDMPQLLMAFPKEVKRLGAYTFGDSMYYSITTDEGKKYYQVCNGKVTPHQLTMEEVKAYIDGLQLQHSYTIDLQEQYDSYYYARKARVPELPVYKICLNNPDETRIYIQPESGKIITRDAAWYANTFVYPRIHTYQFGSFLNNHESIRRGIIWIILIAGAVISITGVQLSVRYIRRKLRW